MLHRTAWESYFHTSFLISLNDLSLLGHVHCRRARRTIVKSIKKLPPFLGAETILSVLLRPEIYAYHRPSRSHFDFSSDKNLQAEFYITLSFCRDSTTTYATEKPAIRNMPIYFYRFTDSSNRNTTDSKETTTNKNQK
jgi:hypothetical protein